MEGELVRHRASVPETQPGGSVIKTQLNKDGTDAFHAFHPESANEVLANYFVGDVVESDKTVENEFALDVRSLKQQFYKLGYYNSSKPYYAFKVSFNLALCGFSFFLLSYFGHSSIGLVVSAFFMGLFWQQCGWLAHDFCHHQVFEHRFYNNLAGYFIGGVCQGFSVDWWKNKHNTHHAKPNVHEEDPDIDTMPFLAWSEHALDFFSDLPNEKAARFVIQNQVIFYFPILCFARLGWCAQSVAHLFYTDRVENKNLERLALLLHHTWYIGGVIYTIGFPAFLAHFILSQSICGLLLALCFSLNHNGMPIVTKEEANEMDFYSLQIITGRDVNSSVFVDWLTGGLNYQIEHHLFPMLPRHQFHKVAPMVRSLCKKHNVPYHATGFIPGSMEIMNRLTDIAAVAGKLEE